MTSHSDALSPLNTENSILDEHLYFTEELVYKYDWDLMDRLDFETRLFQIKTKQEDKLLNLSVVGEFGTGKSTLINALLRSDEFLVSSSLQGTTVAATIVENCEECAIFSEHMNGQQEYRVFESVDALREGLITFTTDSDTARDLYNVRIRMPSEHLSTGFRIIDTPGLNANEKWHEKVTLRAINEMSDMSVLIIDANKPLTTSFCDFVKLTLSDVLDQCVFLVTRIDMIRKRERQGVLDYLKVKVAKEFSIENPIVLPYASVAVLDELYGEPSELSAMSHETEELLLKHMKEKKVQAQRKKIESLIDDMFHSMSDKLNVLSAGYKDELEILLHSKQVDLAPFVAAQIESRSTNFEKAAFKKHSDIIDHLEVFASQSHQRVLEEIDRQPTTDALKKFTANHLTELCLSCARSIINESAKESLAIQELFSSEMLCFHKEFESQFKDYDILKLDFSRELFEKMTFPALDTATLHNTSSQIASAISKSGKASLGSTAAGATIGSVIAPGLGTVIGGAIGFVSGSLLSPNLDKVKATTKEQLSTPLRGYFADVLNNAAVGISAYISDLKKSIDDEINKYLDTYQSAISARIKTEENKIAIVERKIRNIQQDMKIVSERKLSISDDRKDV